MTTIERPPAPHFEETTQFLSDIRERVGRVVVGNDTVVERIMIALLTSTLR